MYFKIRLLKINLKLLFYILSFALVSITADWPFRWVYFLPWLNLINALSPVLSLCVCTFQGGPATQQLGLQTKQQRK